MRRGSATPNNNWCGPLLSPSAVCTRWDVSTGGRAFKIQLAEYLHCDRGIIRLDGVQISETRELSKDLIRGLVFNTPGGPARLRRATPTAAIECRLSGTETPPPEAKLGASVENVTRRFAPLPRSPDPYSGSSLPPGQKFSVLSAISKENSLLCALPLETSLLSRPKATKRAEGRRIQATIIETMPSHSSESEIFNREMAYRYPGEPSEYDESFPINEGLKGLEGFAEPSKFILPREETSGSVRGSKDVLETLKTQSFASVSRNEVPKELLAAIDKNIKF